MAEPDKTPVTLEELLVSSLAQTDPGETLDGAETDYRRRNLCRRPEERVTCQRLLNPMPQ